MIVQCTSCKTKFKVPDEKVGERAVKVRCSKCSAVFAIRRGTGDLAVVVGTKPAAVSPSPLPPAEAPPPPAADPFASLNLAPAQPPPDIDVTTPGLYVAGINASRSPSALMAKAAKPATGLAPPVQRTNTVPLSAVEGPSVAIPGFTPPAPVPMDPFASVPLPPVPPPGESDPFAKLDLATGTSGIPPIAAPGLSESDPFAQLDLSPPPPVVQAVARPFAAAPPEPESDPFAKLDLDAPSVHSGGPGSSVPDRFPSEVEPVKMVPAPAPDQADPFASLNLDAAFSPSSGEGKRAPTQALSPAPATPELSEEISFSFTNKPAAPITSLAKQPDPPAPDPFAANPAFEVANADFGGAGPPPPDPGVGDTFMSAQPTPSAPESGATDAKAVDDFFAAQPEAPPPERDFNAEGAEGEPDRSMFDLPAARPAEARTSAPRADEGALQLVGEEAKQKKKAGTQVPFKKITFGTRSLRELAVSAAVNLVLIAGVAWMALLAYATWRGGGRFDSALLQPRRLVAVLTGAADPAQQLSFDEVTNGLYETLGGRPVFYLVGKVSNRGRRPVGPVKVKLEILDGDRVLDEAEAQVGAVANPEQIHEITNSKSLDSLRKGLEESRGAASAVLAPGDAVPFLVLSLDYPDDIAVRTLRLIPQVGATVAGRTPPERIVP